MQTERWIPAPPTPGRATDFLPPPVPIVRETLTYADPSQKNLGYAVEKGSRSLHLGITKTRNGRVWEPRTLTQSLHRDGLR